MCKPLAFFGHFSQQRKNCQVTNKCHECLDTHTQAKQFGNSGQVKEAKGEAEGRRRSKEKEGAGGRRR